MSTSIWYIHRSRESLYLALGLAEKEMEATPSLSLAERIGSIRALLSGMESLAAPDDRGGG